ncbi:histidine phosphatase family protein [Pseudoroseomonas deserti]|uniref:Histidine phosphatase family protein n=1 Tax=Teichococcus deserti TaxID=1817963 RepID=A0A1V2H3G9_9PROT|nr:histidine phosphatase family protein [Pseudoroseomonas deserti]ONG54267.1 histidine phosphatase family protein [Pseudoroseomonas deserti]
MTSDARLLHFVTHPEVLIDPGVAVPDWPLSERGRARMLLSVSAPWAADVDALFCSAERKARDAAEILAAARGLVPVVLEELGENDRSATGYLPRAEFEATADLFFAHPETSIRGWERAADAQARILRAFEQVLGLAGNARRIAVVAHGGVGALLLSALSGEKISRATDQPGDGGGNVFTVSLPERQVVAGWRRIDAA